MHYDIDSTIGPLPQHELISASELREFVYCERGWFLSQHGQKVSAQGQAQRDSGIVFHEARARAARSGSSMRVYGWILPLVIMALAIIVIAAIQERP
jgi:hypothetical protein